METLKRHVHADLILEFARQKSSGELDAGWWSWSFKGPVANSWIGHSTPEFSVDREYKFEKTDKHPDNQKFVKWKDLPMGTNVESQGIVYQLLGLFSPDVLRVTKLNSEGFVNVFTIAKDCCKLAKEQPWIGESGLISKLSGCVCQLVETDRVGYIEEVTDRTHTKFYISKFKITGLQTGYTLV